MNGDDIMLNEIKTSLTKFINNIKNFVTNYRNGDPLMIKKSTNITVTSFKRSTPDQPLFNLSISGAPEMNILDIAMLIGIVMTSITALGMIGKMCFNMRYRNRWW